MATNPTSPDPAVPTAAATSVPPASAPTVQQAATADKLPEGVNAPKNGSAAEASRALKELANHWCEKYGGKTNYNPHLFIAKNIRPLTDVLDTQAGPLTAEQQKAIAAIPTELPVIDPNWQPPQPSGLTGRPNTTVSQEDVKKIITKAPTA